MEQMQTRRQDIPCNLWDVETGSINRLESKPRNASIDEATAYLDWVRSRADLPKLSKPLLSWVNGSRRDNAICKGATYGRQTAPARWEDREHIPAQWENGAYSVLMPGANAPRAFVTMEELDESGEIVASSTLPIEPKKGGVVWSKADVAKACGALAKPAKARRPKVAPTVAAEAPSPTEAAADMTAVILARLDALEAELAALPAQSITTPSEEMRPQRTAAHERVVRRAWRERCARRAAEVRAVAAAADHCEALAFGERMGDAADGLDRQARRIAMRARRMLIAARKRVTTQAETIAVLQSRADSAATAAQSALSEATDARQGQQAARAELARLKADMADPSQPERSSDIAQLVRDRDAARNACAALQQRCERAEAARDTLADAVEAMAGRMANAEAAVRRLQAA